MSNTLDRALEVEAFLSSQRVDTDAGIVWKRTPESSTNPPRSLYHGTAGVVVFYLELHRVTENADHLATAVSAGDELLAHLDAELTAVARGETTEPLSIAIYSGLPSLVFVLNELAKASLQPRFRDGAKRALDQVMSQSEPLGAGIGWIAPMPFSDITGMTGDRELLDLSIGSAGTGLVLLYAHRQGLDDRALGWARQTADRLLEMSVDSPDGPNWLMMADMPFPFTAPNFAHGAAGVGYFLADLHRETGEQVYLDVALAAAGYVKAKTEPSGDGFLVCHTDENPGLFYLGVCHGPAGTGRFMYLLHEITGDGAWVDWMHENMAGLLATGVPEVRTDGLWTNYGQCCGDAGVGDYALSLYRATEKPEYLDLALRIEAEIIRASTLTDGARSWAQAEHRSRPDFLETQTGYMQGAAGIGSFLLHLASVGELVGSKLAWPDTPFPA